MNKYIFNKIDQLLKIDSPSGFTNKIIDFIKKELDTLEYNYYSTKKGNLIINIKGKSNKNIGLSAHVDTLGLMVSSINPNGTLNFLPIGGPILPTLDSEYCRIYTRTNKIYTGTIISKLESIHVYKDASTLPRTSDNLVVRLDEKVFSKDDVLSLEINNGDYICYDTKTTIVNNFIKSRFLDDKAAVGIILYLLKFLKDKNIELNNNLTVIISTYEEVGHGSSNLPELDELIAIDMGCIGKNLSGDEYSVSICPKDSFSPYDYDLTTKLINLAKKEKINYKIDLYPNYSSDVSAALKSGNDFKAALIGPGVHASHGMERTHVDALINTFNLILAYLKS